MYANFDYRLLYRIPFLPSITYHDIGISLGITLQIIGTVWFYIVYIIYDNQTLLIFPSFQLSYHLLIGQHIIIDYFTIHPIRSLLYLDISRITPILSYQHTPPLAPHKTHIWFVPSPHTPLGF